MHLIICGLYRDYVPIILSIISPLPSEIIEIMSMRFSGQKKGSPHIWKTPPIKILDPCFFRGTPSWKA
jgi:hypothetical protein